ncbi:MAG TPA: RodZ domain-containing protein, partial [Paracoccaceae bacterium]|nr:RodZ domain-containing protein [Paracoccaceae bacterium]
YVVRLGDELRGERASIGKSLLDVQRELKIKAAYIDAIENCDASVFPNPGFIAGYVRAYSRYLGLDPEAVYRRFCEESGFRGVNSDLARPKPRHGSLGLGTGRGAADPTFGKSRFFQPPAPDISLAALSGLGSILILVALVAALGYGGWYLLRDIQRIGIAPVNQAPEVFADLAEPGEPALAAETTSLPEERSRTLALNEIYAPRLAPPQVEPRDGPIAAIDPDSYGIFAAPRTGPAEPPPAPEAAALAAAEPAPGEPVTATTEAAAGLPLDETVAVFARDNAWIRVFLEDGTVLFETILKPGQSYDVPADMVGPFLRAGNAGAVYLRVGTDLYGPLGRGSGIVRKVSLVANDIAASWPRAEPLAPPARPVAQSALLPPGQ